MSDIDAFIWRIRIEFDEAEASNDPDTEGDFGCALQKAQDKINEVPGINVTWDNIDPA